MITEFWVNSLVVMNKDYWKIREFTGEKISEFIDLLNMD